MKSENEVLIGRTIKVVDAQNKNLVGIQGIVLNETRNMLMLKNKRLIKDQVTIEIEFEGKIYKIQGKKLVGRPEERIKK